MSSSADLQVTALTVESYKAYLSRCKLELRPLTILVGRNNAGKSALARLLPLVAQGLLGREGDPPLPLRSPGLVHGRTFHDLIAGRSTHGHVDLELEYAVGGARGTLAAQIQAVVIAGADVHQLVRSWRAEEDGRRVALDRMDLDPKRSEYEVTTEAGPQGDASVPWLGLLPDLADPPWLAALRASFRRWAEGVRYLVSPRRPLLEPFRRLDHTGYSIGIDGSMAVQLLASSDTLRRAVQDWYQRTFDVDLDLRDQGELLVLEVSRPGTGRIAIERAGQGLAQVLPVVVQALTANEFDGGVDIVEHPEAELHPGAHAEVAELLLQRCTTAKRPLVVETHSEMLLLRTRRWVAEGRLDAGNVALYWIDEEGAGATARRIEITAAGEVEAWPQKVFYEDYEEILAIRRAARPKP